MPSVGIFGGDIVEDSQVSNIQGVSSISFGTGTNFTVQLPNTSGGATVVLGTLSGGGGLGTGQPVQWLYITINGSGGPTGLSGYRIPVCYNGFVA